MTFFDAAGGMRDTGLANRYQAFSDMSDLVKLNRAVLVAEAPSGDGPSPAHGAEILANGQRIADPQDRHVTVYRFVLPVGRNNEEK